MADPATAEGTWSSRSSEATQADHHEMPPQRTEKTPREMENGHGASVGPPPPNGLLASEKRDGEGSGDPTLVTWKGQDDPDSPLNWPIRKKMRVTMLFGFTTACSTWASSIFASATPYISKDFHVSTEVAVLGVSLFLLGYAFGPVLWAPLSELAGRKWVLIGSMFVFACFSAATATAENIQTVMITRFFAAVFASCPVTIVGGALADRQRGQAMVLYAVCIVCAPTVAVPVGAALSESYLTWRWTEYLSVILTGVVIIVDLFFLPETSHDIILTQRAKKLRMETQNWAYHSAAETRDHSLDAFMHKLLWVPLQMLVLDPMVLLVTTYTGFVYGIIYLLFSSFDIIFREHRGWEPVPATLANFGVLVGALCAALLNYLYASIWYARYLDSHGGKAPPERRLIPVFVGAIIFPVGFFLIGWTSFPWVNWFPSMVGCAFIGASFIIIFQGGLNYLIGMFIPFPTASARWVGLTADGYTKQAVSVVAAAAFQRSAWATAFPLIAEPMFHNLGIQWGCTLLGCLAVLFAFVPFVFYKYGPKIRSKSRFVPAH